MVYGGWSIADPSLFRASFAGSITRAQLDLDGLIRSAKDEVIGRHPFAHFISTDEKELKFAEIEKEMLSAVRPSVREKYGIDVSILGIQRLGLPESITQKALDRMRPSGNVSWTRSTLTATAKPASFERRRNATGPSCWLRLKGRQRVSVVKPRPRRPVLRDLREES